MSTKTFTFCDRCNKYQITDRGRAGRGYIEWPPTTAIKEFGWKKAKDGIICQDCSDEAEAKP